MTPARKLFLGAAAVAAVQIGFLGWSIAGRAALLRNGEEVRLKVEPIDPRDLLRGDYVRLGYDISTLPVALFAPPPAADAFDRSRTVYVLLRPGEDRVWSAAGASIDDRPAADLVRPGDVVIKGEARSVWSETGDMVFVDYGLDRFYLPEGEGLAIERDMRVRSFYIVAAVGEDGSSQIKALMDGDERLFQEPLY
jgi:uncharacterized membrane-anchored protein